MFQAEAKTTTVGSTIALVGVIYYATVRNVRKSHSNAFIGLLVNMIQVMILVGVFYLMFSVLGLRSAAIRGDFLIYIMSGIFLYMTHTKTLSAVVGSEGPTSPMMQHAPMTTFVGITSAAFGALYIQILSVVVVLFIYDVAFSPVEIYDIVGAFSMILLAWFYGVAIGLIFLAIKPWFPQFANVASTLYTRANMLASGKMFVANTLPFYILKMFDWNPLFHIIDQARGFAFINYNPHYSNTTYPLLVAVAILMLGFMAESYTRRHASISWGAGR